ncbi:MAG: hypothetical protein HY648_10395 [Acidobacteria bacterium]|nr:hypothetical protein [Acidobacteriota bacterium]
MRELVGINGNHRSQRTGRASARRRSLGRAGAALPLLAAVGMVVVLSLGQGSSRAWAQREQQGKEQKPAAADVLPPPEGMSYMTYLEHTAVWVGDQFHYTIAIDYTPEYEFVLDTLNKETVNLEPFHVIDLGTKSASLKNGNRRLYVDLTLASYTTGKTGEQIPQITLFYFRRDQGTLRAQEAAAESLTVPGPSVGLRTTLQPAPEDIRDAITISGWADSRWWLAGAGIFSLVVLVLGTGWETAQYVKRRKARQGPDRRKAMEVVRDRWAMAVPGDFSNPQSTIEFHDRSYHDVKEFVGYYLETPAAGLTSEEIEAEMQRQGADPDFAKKVVATLGTLEAVRYSRNGTSASRETAEKTAQEVREIFAVSVKR